MARIFEDVNNLFLRRLDLLEDASLFHREEI